jgi:putative flavoprotein involved in K+ transport
VDADVVVAGAGPAGLAAAAALRRRGLEPVVLERGDAVGAAWRGRYDALHLHTARSLSGLPYAGIPREHGRWVARDGLVQYLEEYAHRFAIHPRYGVAVERVDRENSGWLVGTSEGPLRARAVVVATGYSKTPFLPDWSGLAEYARPVVHSSDYRNAEPYRGLDMLVAGCGNSGAEIALDLLEGGVRRVRIAVRTPPSIFRRDTLGIPSQPIGILLWRLPPRLVNPIARGLRRLTIPDLGEHGLPTPAVGPYTQFLESGTVPILDTGIVAAVRTGRIEVVAGIEGFDGDEVVLFGGDRVRPDAVVAATGYRTGLEPIVGHLGVLDERGGPTGHMGSLHFIGYTPSLGGLLRRLPGEARRVARALA